jgi:predicted aspartyl protease
VVAIDHGLSIRQWHLDYLRALANVPVYKFQGDTSDQLQFRFGRPDVPRVEVTINGKAPTEAIIDSGAVTSIISQRLAQSLPVRSLGTFEGTFFGLLGEPIPVRFGILDSLQLGNIRIDNVPVAIMPDEKMRFLISRKTDQEFRMDFLLGTNLLKEFRLELNFDRSNAVFTRLTAADRKPGPDQNLFYDGFRPHVRGAINRRGWFLFVLDTGSEITFLNEARLKSLPITTFSQKVHTAMLQGLGGATKRGAKIENVEIGLDEWAGIFKTLPMYGSTERDQSVGIIGQNFLKNFNVVIDFGAMRVDLKRR